MFTSGCKTFQVPNNLPRLTEDYGLDWTPNTILVRVADKERWTKQKRSWPKDGRSSWLLQVVEACQGHDVPVFVKQLGSNPEPRTGSGWGPVRARKGDDQEEWPRRLIAKEIRHVASSAERHIKRFADRLESDIPF